MVIPADLGSGVAMIDANAIDANFTLISNGGGMSATTGITAHAGGTQALGVALTSAINLITVCATNGDSVCLPPAVGGQDILVMNAGVANCNVFSSNASTTDTINGTIGTTAFSLVAAKNAAFVSPASGIWRVILTA